MKKELRPPPEMFVKLWFEPEQIASIETVADLLIRLERPHVVRTGKKDKPYLLILRPYKPKEKRK